MVQHYFKFQDALSYFYEYMAIVIQTPGYKPIQLDVTLPHPYERYSSSVVKRWFSAFTTVLPMAKATFLLLFKMFDRDYTEVKWKVQCWD